MTDIENHLKSKNKITVKFLKRKVIEQLNKLKANNELDRKRNKIYII